MVSTVFAEENLLSELKSCYEDGLYLPGLIIGHCSPKKDYVVQFIPTCEPDLGTDDGSKTVEHGGDAASKKRPKSVNDIENTWISNHAKNVIRMLPGGMCILGLYIVGPGDVLNDGKVSTKIRVLVSTLATALTSNAFLYGDSPHSYNLVFHLCPSTNKYVCKAFDTSNLNNMSVKPVQWKFQSNLDMVKVECYYDLSKITPYFNKDKKSPLKKSLKDVLVLLDDTLKGSCGFINGAIQKDDLSLLDVKKASEEKWKRSDSSRSYVNNGQDDGASRIKVDLCIPRRPIMDIDTRDHVEVFQSCCDVQFKGFITSIAFLSPYSTVKDAISAIKTDIIRSLATRFEMHWDAYEEPSEMSKHKQTQQLPRRVLYPFPQSDVAISQYLFPDEKTEDAAQQFTELLGVPISPEYIISDIEPIDDRLENAPQNINTEVASVPRSNNSRQSMIKFGIIGATLVLLLSILIHFVSRASTESKT